MYRGRLSIRRVRVLIGHLPRDASSVQALVGEPSQWSVTDYLTACVVDAVQELTYATIALNSKHKPQRPKPVRRPTTRQQEAAQDEPKRMSTPKEIAAFFSTLGGR